MWRTLLCLLVSCTPPQAQPPIWSSTAMQAQPGVEPFYGLYVPWAEIETERVTVWAEHYGVPWEAFRLGTTPPSWWAAQMQGIATAARATGKPIDLQVVLSREGAAGHALPTGGVVSGWWPACGDLSMYHTAYRRYVTWMAQTFLPVSMNVAAELSRFVTVCGATVNWTRLVDMERAAYGAAKTYVPIVYASLQLEDLYGGTATGWDAGLWQAWGRVRRDRYAVSTYPQRWTTTGTPLPDDYLTRARRAGETRPLVVAETGWNASDLWIGTPDACWLAMPGTRTGQDAYVAWLATQPVEQITWWSWRDLLPASVFATCYPAADQCGPDAWCQAINTFRTAFGGFYGDLVFKGFGAMGKRTYGGSTK